MKHALTVMAFAVLTLTAAEATTVDVGFLNFEQHAVTGFARFDPDLGNSLTFGQFDLAIGTDNFTVDLSGAMFFYAPFDNVDPIITATDLPFAGGLFSIAQVPDSVDEVWTVTQIGVTVASGSGLWFPDVPDTASTLGLLCLGVGGMAAARRRFC
jgi:hypothetical protein